MLREQGVDGALVLSRQDVCRVDDAAGEGREGLGAGRGEQECR
jgi:hypothetical protein